MTGTCATCGAPAPLTLVLGSDRDEHRTCATCAGPRHTWPRHPWIIG